RVVEHGLAGVDRAFEGGERYTEFALPQIVGQRFDRREQYAFGIAEQILVMFELIQLRRERLDLLDLVVDHLDVFGDFLRRIENLLRVNSRVVYDPLRLKPGDAERAKRGGDGDDFFHLFSFLLLGAGTACYSSIRRCLVVALNNT